MAKKRTVLWFLILILVCGGLVFYYFRYSRYALLPESSATISAGGQGVCFLPGGILVAGEVPVCYDTGGNTLSPSASGLDADTDWRDVRRRGDYVLTADNRLYDGGELPLRMVCDTEEGLDILDFLPLSEDAFLLYAAYRDEAPFLEWVEPGGTPVALPIAEDLAYLSMDYTKDGGASVLFLDATGAAPSTQVLHYRDGELVGSLSLSNAMYYDLYRLPSHILLVGTHQIVCYNVEDGGLLWSVSLSGAGRPWVLRDGDRLLCYLGESAVGMEGDALWVQADGAYETANFPGGLSHLIRCRDMLAAIQNQNTLLVLRRDGAVMASAEHETDIQALYWPSTTPQQLFAQTGDGQVLILGTP